MHKKGSSILRVDWCRFTETPIDAHISVTDVEELKDIACEMDKPDTSSDPTNLGKLESSSNPMDPS